MNEATTTLTRAGDPDAFSLGRHVAKALVKSKAGFGLLTRSPVEKEADSEKHE